MQFWAKWFFGTTNSIELVTCNALELGVWLRLFDSAGPDGWITPNPGDSIDALVSAICRNDPAAPEAFKTLLQRGVVHTGDRGLFVPQRVGYGADGQGVRGSGSRGGKSDADRARAYRQRKAGQSVTDGVTDSVTPTVTGSVTAPSRAIVTGDSVTNCDASRTVTETVTGNDTALQAENKPLESTVTENVTVVTALRREEKREEKKREEEKSDVTSSVTVGVTPPSLPLVLSSESTPKPKRLPTPQPKLPWSVETLLSTLSEASGGAFVVAPFDSALAAPLSLVIRRLHESGCTLDDVRLVGEWAKAGAFHWMAGSLPGLSWLAKAGNLSGAVGQARSWRDGGKRPITAQGNRPAPVQRGPVPAAPASAFPDVDRLQAQREIDANRAEIDAARKAQRIGGVR